MATHARGLICLTLTEERCRQLEPGADGERQPLAHGHRLHGVHRGGHGCTTGISAADRARTVRAATAKHAKAEDIVQPGHIFPVMAQNGGVLVRAGHTEAGCDLAELAGLSPAAVICEIMNPDGSMARMPELHEFAQTHGLKIGTIADLIHYRSETERLIERVAERAIDTPYGPFRLCVYHDKTVDEVHFALVKGDPRRTARCWCACTSPSSRWTCSTSIPRATPISVQDAMRIVAHHKEGVIVLLRRHESGGRDPRAPAGAGARAAPRASGTRACTASARRS